MREFKNGSTRPGYMRVYLCFPGFYNSLLSDRLDAQIEQDAEYYGLDFEELSDAVDWERARLYIAKDYCDSFGTWLEVAGYEPIDFTFKRLYTPKDYFQGPDTIEAEVSTEEPRRLFDDVLSDYGKEFKEYWKKRFTPCDGWAPFYPADMDACGPCEQWPACLWQVVFDFIDSIQADYEDAENVFDDIALANGAYAVAVESDKYVELISEAAESMEA